MLKQVVNHVVKQLVDFPDQVMVLQKNINGKTIVEVYVSAPDLKRVIGKEGRVIRAIRSMVHALAPSGPTDVVLEIAEK